VPGIDERDGVSLAVARPVPKIIRARPSLRLRAVCLSALLLCGCAKSPPVTAPLTGRITVGVTTRDVRQHADTMTFAVDIQPRGTFAPIQADAGLYDEDLPPGEYLVRLTRLPARCHVSGVAQRRVTVSARRTTAVRFSVVCD